MIASPKGKRLNSMSPRVPRACRQRTLPPSNRSDLRVPVPVNSGMGTQFGSEKNGWPSGTHLESKEV